MLILFMQLCEVIILNDWKIFYQVLYYIYQCDLYWIVFLEGDVEMVFDKGKNVNFKEGKVCLWVLFNE